MTNKNKPALKLVPRSNSDIASLRKKRESYNHRPGQPWPVVNYRNHFDCLGHPSKLPELERQSLGWRHQATRWVSVATIAACIFISIWVR